MLQPGWITDATISARHVSAKNLQNPWPTTFATALDPYNIDHNTWLAAYKEKYDDLCQMEVYEYSAQNWFSYPNYMHTHSKV